MFFNQKHEILVVKPVYQDGEDWLIGPGGKVERDETPFQACQREVREELGVDFPLQGLLCIEVQSPCDERDGSVHFIFLGDALGAAQIRQIKLPAGELAEFRFCEFDEAMNLLGPRLGQRLVSALAALEQKRIIYLEAGVEI